MFKIICASLIAFGQTVCALVGKGQHRVLKLVQFLKFQNHRGHVYNYLWKFNRNRMNGVCSYTTYTHTHTHHKHTQIAYTDIDVYIYCGLNFLHHRKHVYNNFWKFHRNQMNGVCSNTGHTHTHTHTHTHIAYTDIDVYIYCRLNFQYHREHVYNNFWKLHRNRMNGVCSCRESATLDTPASTIFKVPKPPRAYAQQFLKVSSQ